MCYHLFYSDTQKNHRTIIYTREDGRRVEITEVKKVSDEDPEALLKKMKKFFPDVQYLGVGTWSETRYKDSWSGINGQCYLTCKKKN